MESRPVISLHCMVSESREQWELCSKACLLTGPLSTLTVQITVELVPFRMFGGAHGSGMPLHFIPINLQLLHPQSSWKVKVDRIYCKWFV